MYFFVLQSTVLTIMHSGYMSNFPCQENKEEKMQNIIDTYSPGQDKHGLLTKLFVSCLNYAGWLF